MIRQNEIVLYRNTRGHYTYGIIKGIPKKKASNKKFQIYPLVKESDSNQYKIAQISSRFENVDKNSIFFKITNVKKFKLNSIDDLRIEFQTLQEHNLKTLLNWPNMSKDEQNELIDSKIFPINTDENEGKQLQLRKRRRTRVRTRNMTKMTYGSFMEVFDFAHAQGEKEWWELKIKNDKTRQKEQLPKFIRTATTNLRFDLPEKASEIERNWSQIDFLDPRLKSHHQTILKTLSQDLNSVFNPQKMNKNSHEPTSSLLKFTEVIQHIIRDMDESYNHNLNVQLDETIVSLEYINVPSLKEMEKTLHYLKSVNNFLKGKIEACFQKKVPSQQKQEATSHKMAEETLKLTPNDLLDGQIEKSGIDSQKQFTETNLYHLIISNIFIFCLRFFMSQKTNRLHLLKNKLYLENFQKDGISLVEKLNNMVKSLRKFVKTLKDLMTDQFNSDYLEMLKGIACLIGNKSEKICNKSISDCHERIKAKQYLATFAFDILKELINYEDAESQTIEVLYSFLTTVRLNTQFTLKPKQTYLSQKLNVYFNDRINHTNKKWNLFVDACCQFIKEKKLNLVRNIQSDSGLIDLLTQRMISIQASIAKGVYLSVLRVLMDLQVEKLKEGSGDEILGKPITAFLNSLLESSDKLPIFVYFVQAVTEKYGNLKGVAKKKKISSIDTFIQKFMFYGGIEGGNNLKYDPREYQAYIDAKNRLFYIIGNEESNEKVIQLIKDALPSLVERGTEQTSSEKSGNNSPQRELIWRVLVNEIWTSYLSDEAFPGRDFLVKTLIDNMEIFEESYSAIHLKFLTALVTNFESIPVLSLGKGKKNLELMSTLVHTMISHLMTDNPIFQVPILKADKLRNPFNGEVLFTKFENLSIKQSMDGEGTYTPYNLPYPGHLMLPHKAQLAALPSLNENKYQFIASTFYKLDSNWSSGQQFTKLYQCECGYLYWIGDCGRAWVVGKCPSCGKSIGGRSHTLANKKNKEISKELFFSQMYSPLEEKSGSLYRTRKIIEFDEDGKDSIRWVDQTPRWDELESAYERAELLKKARSKRKSQPTDMTEEKDEQKTEGKSLNFGAGAEAEVTTIGKRNSSFEPIRNLEKEAHFLIIEFLTHSRHLLDFVFMSTEEFKYYKYWMGLLSQSALDYHKYLFDVCLSDFKRIKGLEFPKLDSENYFKGFNILVIENLFPTLDENKSISRNNLECELKNTFELVKPEFQSFIEMRLAVKSEVDGNIQNSTKLVKNWVNRMASINELQKKTKDIKLLRGMRMGKHVGLDNLKEYLNVKMIEYQKAGAEREKELSQIKFIVYVIGFEEILSILQDILYSHIDLTNYLERILDFKISYKMACSVNMRELISSELDEQLNTCSSGATDQEISFVQKRKLLVQRCNGDQILKLKFEKVKAAWTEILKYREKYTESFDFRFLCHAEEMPEEKINDILGENSKLIYFLPNEKYVESLFMSATLQTLSKIQNKVIEEHPHQFFRANYTKARKTAVQSAKRSEIVNLRTCFLDLINRCSYANLTFNKDGELIYNLDMMERELSLDLFFGRKKLMFEDKYIRNFNFAGEFSEINRFTQRASMKFGQTFLDKPYSDHLDEAIKLSPEETLAIFGRKLKELSSKEFNLSFISQAHNPKDEFVLKFERGGILENYEITATDKFETEIVKLLNKCKITLNNIRYVYEQIEKELYGVGLENLDPHFRVPLNSTQKAYILRLFNSINSKNEKNRVSKVAKGMVLRLLVGSTNENIGKSPLGMSMEYSDVLHEDEEIAKDFLDGLKADNSIVIGNLPAIVELLKKHNQRRITQSNQFDKM